MTHGWKGLFKTSNSVYFENTAACINIWKSRKDLLSLDLPARLRLISSVVHIMNVVFISSTNSIMIVFNKNMSGDKLLFAYLEVENAILKILLVVNVIWTHIFTIQR